MKDNIANYGKVAVLMGGNSAERAISLKSGKAVLNALKKNGIDAIGFDVGADIFNQLQRAKIDRVFIAMHGRGGEDGLIQGGLEYSCIPYTGSGVLGAALAMDKSRSKAIWRYHGLPTPNYEELNFNSNPERIFESLGVPIMLKPVHEGSSFGAFKVSNQDEFVAAWREARRFDKRVIAETWIFGDEYTVPILGDRVLPLIKLEVGREFYDYVAKYEADDTRYICPCGLSEQRSEQLGKLAKEACQVLDVSGWGRVDVLVDESGQPWLIEANTVPGLTTHSLVPMAAKQIGVSFEQLILHILDTSFSLQESRYAGCS